MPKRDIVVIGGSAGCFPPLRAIIAGLPRDFPAAVFVVIHMSAESPSLLDRQLSRWGALSASCPFDGEAIQFGHIYVSRPDYHITLERGMIRIVRGPRENRHRPAIDPLFRSAARVYGRRAIGVLLSGLLDDGSTGLFAIKQRGGLAIVQDPKDAYFNEMPLRALAYAAPQYVLSSDDIAPNLVSFVTTEQDGTDMPQRKSRKHEALESDVTEGNIGVAYFDEGEGIPSVFACPECHGVLWELKDKELVRFRCRVGHSYGPDSLAKELSQASESALWAAMRALEEKSAMQRRVADGITGNKSAAVRLRDQSDADAANARLIRDMIFRGDSELELQKLIPETAPASPRRARRQRKANARAKAA